MCMQAPSTILSPWRCGQKQNFIRWEDKPQHLVQVAAAQPLSSSAIHMSNTATLASGACCLLGAYGAAAAVRRRHRTSRRSRRRLLAAVGTPGDVFVVEPLTSSGNIADEALAVWMHGYGDTGSGWATTAPALQSMGLPMLRILIPTAPIRDTMTGSSGPCPSWYDVDSLDPDVIANKKEPPPGLRDSTQYVLDLVEPYVRRGLPPKRIFFVGFSQGGGVALAAALRAPRAVGGALLLSSWVAEPLPPVNCEAAPIHFFHGVEDPVVTLATARRGHDALKAAGLKTSFCAYPGMAQGFCDAEVDDVARVIYEALH